MVAFARGADDTRTAGDGRLPGERAHATGGGMSRLTAGPRVVAVRLEADPPTASQHASGPGARAFRRVHTPLTRARSAARWNCG